MKRLTVHHSILLFAVLLMLFTTKAGAIFTGHVEATTDALLLALDSDYDGSITDETWYQTFAAKLGAGDVGTAASLDYEDTLTDGDNLPKGSAVKAYGDANWVDGIGAFNLSDGGYKIVDRLTLTAGENWLNGYPLYLKYDGISATKSYIFTADSTDTDNDTYPIVGFALTDVTSGNTGIVFTGKRLLMRRDEFNFSSADIGKRIYPLSTAGAQNTEGITEQGDHHEPFAIVVGVDGVGGVTGDYLLYAVPTASVVKS
jgi:hypothetical protein